MKNIIEVEANEYVIRYADGYGEDRRPRTDRNLRILRREYAAFLPGGELYGETPRSPDELPVYDEDGQIAMMRSLEYDPESQRDLDAHPFEDRADEYYAD